MKNPNFCHLACSASVAAEMQQVINEPAIAATWATAFQRMKSRTGAWAAKSSSTGSAADFGWRAALIRAESGAK